MEKIKGSWLVYFRTRQRGDMISLYKYIHGVNREGEVSFQPKMLGGTSLQPFCGHLSKVDGKF